MTCRVKLILFAKLSRSTNVASSPGPIPSFSMFHFSACNIEKLGIGPGDEATTNVHVVFPSITRDQMPQVGNRCLTTILRINVYIPSCVFVLAPMSRSLES